MQVQSSTPTTDQNDFPSNSVAANFVSGQTKAPPIPPAVISDPSSIPPAQSNNLFSAKNVKPDLDKNYFGEKALKMNPSQHKGFRSKKQIPTILGLLVLFVAMISGVLLFGQGTGVFAPRATPETTPKNIRISNVTDKTFTISFFTAESTIAYVKYGEEIGALNKQASDDRDQLSGVVKDYHLHHITVRGLNPGKNYYYILGTGSSSFDNEGQPYSVSTAAKPNQSPTNNQTIYGKILNSDGSPAEGSVVYLYSEGMGALSSLVKSSGSWGISLANAFNIEKSNYAILTDETLIDVKVQGIDANSVSNLQTTVALAQPVTDLTLGQENSASVATSSATSNLQAADKEELLAGTASDSVDLSEVESSQAAEQTASLSEELQSPLASDSTATAASESALLTKEVLNLSEIDENKEASATTITTTQPQIKANLPANTMIRVVVHSDTAIDETVQTDANGDMTLDVASLGKNLEPGEHSASYTYIDPVTGKEVTKTYNFTVDPTAKRQLASAADLGITATPKITKSPSPIPSIPYGSGNPFTPTVSVTKTASPSVSVSASSSKSAIVSTASGQYNSGSVGTTLALLLGGLFFVLAGVWSYYLAVSFEQKKY